MMTIINYFAYGSNMSQARLQARTPSARSLGVHSLPQHQLRFHKTGKDDSGKCDAYYTKQPQHSVMGVLYQLHVDEKPILDTIEGLGWGYEIKEVDVISGTGNRLACFTYSAIRTAEGLVPYEWYLHHVLTGAVSAGLPDDYIAHISRTAAKPDPDPGRHAREMSIYPGHPTR